MGRWLARAGAQCVLLLAAVMAAIVTWSLLWPIHGGDFFPENSLRPDPEIGWVLRSSYRGGWFTDKYGARVAGPNIVHPIPVGLLVVGDSQTFGAGVPVDETFTAVAGRLTGLTTVNYGVGSYSGVSALLTLRRHLADRPRFVVYALEDDHLKKNFTPCMETGDAYFCVERPVIRMIDGTPRIRLPHGPVRWLPAAWERWPLVDRVLTHVAVLRGELERASLSAADQKIAGEYIFRQMEATARGAGAELIVVWLSDWDKFPVAPPWISELAREARFTFIDTGPRLTRLRAGGQVVWVGHLTPVGHRAIGEAIAEAIRAHSTP